MPSRSVPVPPSHPSQPIQTHFRPSIPILGLHNITWPFTTNLGPPPQSQALLALPRPSYPSQTFHTTLCHLDQFQNPFTPILTHSHPSEALNTYQSLHYQYQALFTHLKSFKPSQALHTHQNIFTLISGPPRPPKYLHTHLWHSMPLLGSPALFLGLLHLP